MMEVLDFFVDDYKLKADYLTAHLGRMWTRFQFFLTVTIAMFGFLGFLLFEPGIDTNRSLFLGLALWGGFLVAIIWYVTSAQDRYLVKSYRADLKAAAKRISERLPPQCMWTENDYVGSRSDKKSLSATKSPSDGEPPVAEKPSRVKKFIKYIFEDRYCERLSITRLPALLSFLLIFLWGAGVVLHACGVLMYLVKPEG